MPDKTVAESQVTLTLLMGPVDANIMGNVHGGILMKLCDEAGGMAATKHASRPAVTVAVDSMTFHSPVHIGNLVTVHAQINWVGRSSMEARVVVTAENVLTNQVTHTNTAYFVYVALDNAGKPTAVPPLIVRTDEEKARFARAEKRQSERLQRREHL